MDALQFERTVQRLVHKERLSPEEQQQLRAHVNRYQPLLPQSQEGWVVRCRERLEQLHRQAQAKLQEQGTAAQEADV